MAWSFKNVLVSDSNLSAVDHVEDLHEGERVEDQSEEKLLHGTLSILLAKWNDSFTIFKRKRIGGTGVSGLGRFDAGVSIETKSIGFSSNESSSE